MTAKLDRAAGNEYFTAPDSPALTFPSGWTVGGVVVMDSPITGAVVQMILSTGSGSGSFSLGLTGDGYSIPNSVGFFSGSSSTFHHGGANIMPTTGAWLIALTRPPVGRPYIRICPILSALPLDASAVKSYEIGGAGGFTDALEGSGPFVIGTTGALTASRLFNQSVGRVFVEHTVLTDLELANIAYGKTLMEIGKAPPLFYRLDDHTDLANLGTLQGVDLTPSGTLSKGSDPRFGYSAAGNSPPAVAAPAINGAPQVGTTVTYTRGEVTGHPPPEVSQQWYLDNVAIAGATGLEYIPVVTDATKTLSVGQIAINTQDRVEVRSLGKVVAAAANAVYLVPPDDAAIFPRKGTSAVVAMSGTYTGTQPTSIQYRLLDLDGITERKTWASFGETITPGGTFTAAPSIPQTEKKRRIQIRTMSGTTELARSEVYTNRFGVGALILALGSSSAEAWGTSGSSGSDLDVVSLHRSGTWRPGLAVHGTRMATRIAAKLGVCVGFIARGVGGTSVSDWLTTNRLQVWSDTVETVTRLGGLLEGMFFSLGSNDAAGKGVSSRAAHGTRVNALFNKVRMVTGQPMLPGLISGFNRRTKYDTDIMTPAEFDQQANWVRGAENDIGEPANWVDGAPVYHVQALDFILSGDGIHLSDFTDCTNRMAQVWCDAMDGNYQRGPAAISMVTSGNDVLVNLRHRGSTDFSPITGITGFAGTGLDDLPLTILGAARVSANQIRVSCDRPAKTLQYLAGSAPAVGTPVYGNTAQPLPMTVETEMALTAAGEEVPDTTAPVMSGAISITNVTTSGATLAFQAATDNVGVAGYEYSTNAGASYVNAGLSRSLAVSALTASTTYQVRARAYDDAGNRSAPLSASFTTLANEPPVEIVIDASKIPASRKVVFPGGTRVIPFGTKPNSIVPDAPYYRNGKWWIDKVPEDERYYVADFRIDLAEAGSTAVKVEVIVSGVKVLEQPVIQGHLIPVKLGGLDTARGALNFCTFRVTLANGEQLDRTVWLSQVDGRWTLEKDPEDKRYYVADVGFDLADSNTTATAATAMPVGVVELVKPQVQGSLIVVKLGGLDVSADPLNYCQLRIDCANGERFYRTIHFTRVDN